MTSVMQNMVIGSLIFGALLFAFIGLTVEMTANYGVEQDVSFNQTLTVVQDTNNLLSNQTSFTESTQIDEDAFSSMGKEGFKTLYITFIRIPKILKATLSDLSLAIGGIPVWFIGLVLSIVTAIIIFTIVRAFFKV